MINKPGELTRADDVTMMSTMFDSLFSNALSVKNTSVLPTLNNVSAGEVVIYDDGAGTKRIYVVTGKKNLGYITLT